MTVNNCKGCGAIWLPSWKTDGGVSAAKEKTREAFGYRGFLDLQVLHRTEYWWSRRESNPRP
ncbi:MULTISPECIES: hypothetical protein [Cupriavidus]|uniref:hypothetical protein n=1 Tax=Cupriavidus TaxID=106589 RepID=UPI00128FE45C|nr:MULTISPECIES: hypothetical protein [Cupriavidus]QQB77325.1 hypothetical protein I6H87_03100 [Cupriavidus necator]